MYETKFISVNKLLRFADMMEEEENSRIDCFGRKRPLLLNHINFRYVIKKLIKIYGEDIVRCKDCKYRGDSIGCPMCYDEYTWDEDDGGDWHINDRTIDDGYCDRGEKEEVNNG